MSPMPQLRDILFRKAVFGGHCRRCFIARQPATRKRNDGLYQTIETRIDPREVADCRDITGLANNRKFVVLLEKIFEKHQRSDGPVP